MLRAAPDRSSDGIARETLSVQVCAWLRAQILNGDLKQGEHLNEQAISRQTGVSATPVREALRMLRGQGLVALGERRGARVIRPTEDEIRSCFSVRRTLECLALREASATRLDRRDLDLLLRLAESTKGAGLTDPQAFFEADDAFHQFFVSRANNSWLESFLATLKDFLIIVRRPLYSNAKFDTTRLEHVRIARAFADGRFEAAERLLAKHIDRVCRDVLGEARRRGTPP